MAGEPEPGLPQAHVRLLGAAKQLYTLGLGPGPQASMPGVMPDPGPTGTCSTTRA